MAARRRNDRFAPSRSAIYALGKRLHFLKGLARIHQNARSIVIDKIAQYPIAEIQVLIQQSRLSSWKIFP